MYHTFFMVCLKRLKSNEEFGIFPLHCQLCIHCKKGVGWLVRAFFAINRFILWMICADWQDRPSVIQAPKCSQMCFEAFKNLILAFEYEKTISVKLRVTAVNFWSNIYIFYSLLSLENRLSCLLLFKGLAIWFILGWSSSIIQFRQYIKGSFKVMATYLQQ